MEFSDIALAKFLQSSPELGNSIVTFKDVSDELSDESDIKVGIFILRAGADMFFVPVISKSDNVYPIDSVFFQSKGKFLPLTKKVSEQILNSQELNIGSKTKIPPTVMTNPSVFDLVNPPRTGKFVYASSSRLIEFLATIPNHLKEYLKEKFVGDKGLYGPLNKLFGLDNVLAALQPNYQQTQETVGNSVSVITGGNDMGQEEIQSILANGYAIRGKPTTARFAVNAEDFSRMGKMQQVSQVDGGKDYQVMMDNGETRFAFIPQFAPTSSKMSKVSAYDGTGNSTVAIFENGDYALTNNLVVAGEPGTSNEVLTNLFASQPPVMLKDIARYGAFAVFDLSMKLVGLYRAQGTVSLTNFGAMVRAEDLVTHQFVNLIAYRSYKEAPHQNANDVFIPYNSLVIQLGNDKSFSLEVNINSAQKRRSLAEMLTLGASLDLGYDGVEFSVDGSPVGAEPEAMKVLIIREGIAPNAAQNFVKQAKVNKRVKLYLSKKADFEPAEVPQFGDPAQEQQNTFGAGLDAAVPNIKNSLQTDDGQIVESSIIAELLQTPDLFEKIEEYLPDIEEAVDKLGRILFLSRVHIDKLAEANDPDYVFAFLASLKNVYRTLGDTFIKLQQISANVVSTPQ